MEEILPPEIIEHIFEQFECCSYCKQLLTRVDGIIQTTTCKEKTLSKCSKTCSRWNQIVEGMKQRNPRNDFFSIPCLGRYLVHGPNSEKYLVSCSLMKLCIIIINKRILFTTSKLHINTTRFFYFLLKILYF